MSDTSTLIAIKYKGQMINLPGDSSVSWNDLTDKPVVIKQGGTETITKKYDIVSYLSINNLRQNGYGWGDSGTLYVSKNSITNAINALSSLLSDDLKNIWMINLGGRGDDDWDVDVVIDIDNEEVLYFNGDMDLTLKDEYLDEDGSYWKILVNDPQIVLDDDDSVRVDIYPVNFITSDNQTVTSLSYTETIEVPGQWYFDPDHIEKDASVGILWDTSAGPDLSDYYTKTQIDTSIANNYASKNDISAFITSNDISTKLEANDVSLFTTTDDVSNLITLKVGIFKITGSSSNKQGYTDNPDSSFGDSIGTNGFIIGNNRARGINSFSVGNFCDSLGAYSFTANNYNYSYGSYGAAFGTYTRALGAASFASGERTEVNNSNEAGFGAYNDSSKNSEISINTLFSVGNGRYFNGSVKKHNALEIKKNGDVYIPDTDDTANANYYEKPMKRLQDLFALDTSIANNYASKNDISTFITSNDVSIYLTDNDISTFITANDISTKLEANDVSLFASKSDVSVLDTSVSLLWDSSTQGGGGSGTVSLQYLTQAEYDALQTIDQNTLYLIS